jgi:diadenosine tetraphosphate (Ap4A) HIT family hydrolase
MLVAKPARRVVVLRNPTIFPPTDPHIHFHVVSGEEETGYGPFLNMRDNRPESSGQSGEPVIEQGAVKKPSWK